MIPVYAVWQEKIGPLLSLGMLTATARAYDDGRLASRFEIRRPETADEVIRDLEGRDGPAVLLCSDYVWSLDDNLELARRAKAICPQLVVIHGGPSSPKYIDDAVAFLDAHGDVADVLVRGEGEIALCEVLEALDETDARPRLDLLREVAGLTFRNPVTGEVVRTADRERLADLDELPSPYLTGEFDHIDPSAWLYCVSIETNRGCPYGCTFCDWGSATMARIRKFDLERVKAELTWCAERGIIGVQVCDANFGIMRRDLEIAEHLASVHLDRGAPQITAFTPAKNTSKYLTQILDTLIGSGVVVTTAISLQTTDEATLELVKRSNISTDAYLALAADLRRRGLPLSGDILLGLPGQTYGSYKADLQFFLDHEIEPRTWRLRLLPNAPMNEPSYRERFEIQTDVQQLVTSTSTMTVSDRLRMEDLRKIQVISSKFGILRHVLNYVQWDHGIAAMDVVERIQELKDGDPGRYPTVSWVFEYFDLYTSAPGPWRDFYLEVTELLAAEFGLASSTALEAVLDYQLFVMPAPGRPFPATAHLAHDYPSYYRSATASLYRSGHAGRPVQRLEDHPPVELTIVDDPLDLCGSGLEFLGDSRDATLQGNFWIGIPFSYELPTQPPLRADLASRDQMTSTTLDSTARA